MLQAGMNIAEIRRIAAQLDGAAQAVASSESAIGMLVSQSRQSWSGPDVMAFESEWSGRHRGDMRRLSEAVAELARSLRSNADDQERASGIGSASASGSGAAAFGGSSAGTSAGTGTGPTKILPDEMAFVADRLFDLGDLVASNPGQSLKMARFNGFFSGMVGTMEFINDPTMETGFGAVGGVVGGLVGGVAGAGLGPVGSVAAGAAGSAIGSAGLGWIGGQMDQALTAIVTGEPGPAEKFFAWASR